MPRPKLDERKRRTRTIGVRVSPEEFDEARKKAVGAHLSIGKLTRRLLLGQVVQPVVAAGRFSVEERRELHRIGINLNQAVRALSQAAKVLRGGNVTEITRLARQIRKTALRISEQVVPPEGGGAGT